MANVPGAGTTTGTAGGAGVQTSGALVVNVNDAVATISPAAFGSWSLRIEGYNARAAVKRIK